ncbi:MAG: hypothetical protein KDJ77_18005, partial [Rhodobiaceae bacterium]|nr:hypothetical protein [Rhodobiaceae bacterium]
LNPHFGTPHNPFDPDTPRAPGGSSAGSAVAVASGLAPCAIGTDTGGSVRIPSAFNGLTGHKSSEGRIPKGGVFPLSETLDTVGPLARSVEDCILLDMVMRGAATTTVRRLPLSGLSLFVPETVVLTDLDSAVAANFEATLSRLEQAGVKIARGPLDIFAEIVRITAEHGSLGAAEAYHVHRSLVEGPDVGRIDRRVVARIMGGKPMSALDLVIIEHARREFAARLAEKIGDALIAMPTVPMTAPKIAPLEADDAVFGMNNLKALRNTMLGNFLNLPGLALPNGTDEHGLPTSFLLCALGGDDDRLLSYGLSVEKVVRG